jgi:hypothetical protein
MSVFSPMLKLKNIQAVLNISISGTPTSVIIIGTVAVTITKVDFSIPKFLVVSIVKKHNSQVGKNIFFESFLFKSTRKQ